MKYFDVNIDFIIIIIYIYFFLGGGTKDEIHIWD